MMCESTASADYTIRDQERMEQAKRYFEWQFALAEKHLGPRVLEIGCGLGNFTRHLLEREHVVAIDCEPRCTEAHRRRFTGHSNLETVCLDVLSPDFLELRRHAPDSIACLNVLEHISADEKALTHMNAVLPSGGTAVLIVPAFQALYGPIDANLGHARRYTKRSFRELAALTGFRPKILRYINSVGFFGWWFNARILKRTEQSSTQIRIFDSLVMPPLSLVEHWIEPPVGQSVLAVLEKA